MRLNQIIYITALFFIFSSASKAQNSTYQNSKQDSMAFVQVIQDPKIEVINNYFKEISSADTMIIGYRIQIYFGNRNQAYDKRNEFREEFPDMGVNIIYEEPNFKTVVGEFQTKLDADRELLKIQEKFTDAFIIRNEIRREY
jgi:hypothetical protein